MIDTVDSHIRMLKRFDIDTEAWSPLVCVIILRKLDRETCSQWENKTDLPKIPNIGALFNHMKQRILAIRNMKQGAQRVEPHLPPKYQPLLPAQVNGNQTRTAKPNAIEQKRYHPYDRKPHHQNASAKGNPQPSACLGTIQVRVQLSNGDISIPIRGFCESGSTVSLISEICAEFLCLHRRKSRIPIAGIGSTTMATGTVELSLLHRKDVSDCIVTQALVVPRIQGVIYYVL